MEGILRSIVAAGYRQLQGRGLVLFRYDAVSDSFPDEWRLVQGEITRRYSTRVRRDGMAARILQSGKPVVVNDAHQVASRSPYAMSEIRSYIGVPIVVDDLPWGVLYVNSSDADAFGDDDLSFVQALARQLGAAISEAVAGNSGNVELSTVRVLAATVDAKDHYTRHHSTNVSFYARSLAREMGLDPAEVRRVELAGLLHDIGKIAIPDQILQKPGTLTAEERLLVQTHASIGGNILAQASHLKHLVLLVRHHHEKYDGSGYPDGLKGDEIPLGAAILNLADSFDTMTTRRVYRAPLHLDAAMAELQRCSGTQFHPEMVRAFERFVARARETGEPWVAALTVPSDRGATVDTWPLPTGTERPEPALNRDPLDLLVEARLLQHTAGLPAVIHRAGEQVMDFWSADAVQVYLVNDATASLSLGWSGGSQFGQEFLAKCRAEAAIPMAEGLIGWVSVTNQGITVPDARRDPRWTYGDVFDGPVSVMVSPIGVGPQPVGVLQILARGESRFGWPDLKVMKVFGALAGQAITAARQVAAPVAVPQSDDLTGLHNAQYLRSVLDQLDRTGYAEPVSVGFIDGDDLRGINERYGYDAGDQVIRHIARCLHAWRRAEDVVVRYGADEFAVIFVGLSLPEASARLERIRLTVSEVPLELGVNRRAYVTVSCGVTEVDAALGARQALRSAEQAMHNAKRTGKNRIWTVAG